METISKQTFSDLSVILKMMPNNMLKKINPKFREYIINNCDENCKSCIKPYIPLKKQEINYETQSILALIYESYFATYEERKQIQKERNDQINLKYNSDSLFKNKKYQNEKHELLIIKKQSFFEKIIKKLKYFFMKQNK